MFLHNLRIIFRGFLKFKNPFITNLVGLSTGLASVILIYVWVNDELMFDKFHVNGNRLFQVMENQQQDGVTKTSGQTAPFLAQILNEEMSEVELAAVVTPPNFFPSFTLSTTDRNVKGVGKFVSKDFFNMFSYPLVAGHSTQLLENKSSIVLSESLAKKLFRSPEVSIGKSISWKIMGIEKETIVSGVYKDVPNNSSEQFDFVLTFDSFKELMGIKDGDVNWDSSAPFFTYLLVREGTNIDQLNNKIGDLLLQKSKNNQHRSLFIKQYTDNYLYGKYENGKEAGGRIEYVKLFSTIAVFILLIACINFVNLSTAQALRKIKDTGIKKIIGAQQRTLILQYLQEAFVITVLSFLFAFMVVKLVLPQFSLIAGKNLQLVPDGKTTIVFASLIFITSLAAGLYPALYLSRFSPMKGLKRQFNSSMGELWARGGLVVFQFSLSVIFIVFVWVVYKQIEFIQTKNLGYNKENIIYFEAEGKISANPEPIIAEITKIPGVSNVSSMLGGIVAKEEGGGMPGAVTYNGKKVTMNNSAVNYGLIELLGMEMKEGRAFSKDHASDVDKVIFNEAAIEALGVENPVGKIVDGGEVLGVVKDFHYQSLRETVKPYCFRMEPNATSTIMVKIQGGSEEQIIGELEKIYKSHNPGYVFNYSFLDSDYQQQYVAEKRVSVLSQYATILTIVISCLGLFGLVTFTTEKRGKEIAIRKVLGSSEAGVVMLLTNEFMKLVVIAALAALPVSYFIVNGWLGSFAYKIDLQWWYFAGAAATTILLSWLTVVSKSLKAAKTNPADALKSE